MTSTATGIPIRREPPPFRRVQVARVVSRTPRLARVTLSGPELEGLELGLPAGSVRLLLPSPGDDALSIPEWNGNEFLRADGTRPPIRTLTPLRLDGDPPELDVEVVRHGAGALSSWVDAAEPGSEVAVSGTGRGYTVDAHATSFLLAGDESALPAISVLLPALPADAEVRVVVEVADPSARLELPEHPRAQIRWCEAPEGTSPGDALVAAVIGEDIDPGSTRVWAAGEAAAVQRIRRHLFTDLGVRRSHTVVRGYWKHGRAGIGSDA